MAARHRHRGCSGCDKLDRQEPQAQEVDGAALSRRGGLGSRREPEVRDTKSNKPGRPITSGGAD